MCPVDLPALYRQRLRWAVGWEEVAQRTLPLVFGSSALTRVSRRSRLPNFEHLASLCCQHSEANVSKLLQTSKTYYYVKTKQEE
eukprot:1805220-Pleurochrysis_carterae.AAC.2